MAVNKVVVNGEAIIDLSADTVTADKLAAGYTAHDKSGAVITGTMDAGGGVSSFNGRNGAVEPKAGDYTADMVGADPSGTASTKVSEHNSAGDPHPGKFAAASHKHDPSDINTNADHRFVTDTEKAAWNENIDGVVKYTEQNLTEAQKAQARSNIGAAPAYTYGTTDLTAGSSALETGKLYFVYE